MRGVIMVCVLLLFTACTKYTPLYAPNGKAITEDRIWVTRHRDNQDHLFVCRMGEDDEYPKCKKAEWVQKVHR
jgi:hypothetical protein